MGELGLLFFYLIAASEPTLQVAVPLGDFRSREQREAGQGFGFRWRIGVGEQDAVRLRIDRSAFGLKAPVPGEGLQETRVAFGAEYLWRGAGGRPGFYGGGGLDLVRSHLYKEVPALVASVSNPAPHWGTAAVDLTTNYHLGAGATAGRGFQAGPGLLVTEARLTWTPGPTGRGETILMGSLGYRWTPKK